MNRLVLLAPFALALTTPAVAGPFGHRDVDPQRAMEHVEKTLEEVDATDEQQATVRGLLQEALPVFADYRDEGKALRDEIHGLFHADVIDPVAIEEARGDVVDLFDRATSTVFSLFVDVSQTLSQEQRVELHEMRQERRRAWRRHLGVGD